MEALRINYKGILNEWSQKERAPFPTFVVKPFGPAHKPAFHCTIMMGMLPYNMADRTSFCSTRCPTVICARLWK